MGDKTGISWCDSTWNPTVGCSRVSPGCEHCYAEKMARRLGMMHPSIGVRDRYAALIANFWAQDSSRWRWNGKVDVFPDRLDQPLRWRRPRKVFVNSMSDLFHESVPDEFIDAVFAVMALAPQHQYQLLTKRPDRMRAWFQLDRKRPALAECLSAFYQAHPRAADIHPLTVDRAVEAAELPWPLPNVWLGVSVEDQKRADERIPLLLQTPAAVRFLSCEPLLGPVEFNPSWLSQDFPCPACDQSECDHRSIDWVIIGGESGPGARPCNVEWIRSIVEQCRKAEVACFTKQLGARPIEVCPYPGCEPDYDGEAGDCPTHPLDLVSRKGDDPSEWPEDLRFQEFPA